MQGRGARLAGPAALGVTDPVSGCCFESILFDKRRLPGAPAGQHPAPCRMGPVFDIGEKDLPLAVRGRGDAKAPIRKMVTREHPGVCDGE